MRGNKLALALILFGAFAVTTASASMPQKASPSLKKSNLPVCTCSKEEDGRTLYGIYDEYTQICDTGSFCWVSCCD